MANEHPLDSSGEIGRLQAEILEQIAGSSQRLTVNQLAAILNKAQTTIFSSTELLIQRKHLTFDQEYPRGRKWLKLTHMGAFMAIASFSEISYSTVYRNHSYLKMPPVIQDLADCTLDEASKSKLVSYFVTRLLYESPPLEIQPEGQIYLGDKDSTDHYFAALILDVMFHFLSSDPNPKLINYEKVRAVLTKAKTIFENSFMKVNSKVDRYDMVIRGVQQEKDEVAYVEGAPTFNEFMRILEKNHPNLYRHWTDFMQKEREAHAMKSKAPARKAAKRQD